MKEKNFSNPMHLFHLQDQWISVLFHKIKLMTRCITWKIGINIEIGPEQKTGTLGPILSIYIRDPDFNLNI